MRYEQILVIETEVNSSTNRRGVFESGLCQKDWAQYCYEHEYVMFVCAVYSAVYSVCTSSI